jgi:hypothetical protein
MDLVNLAVPFCDYESSEKLKSSGKFVKFVTEKNARVLLDSCSEDRVQHQQQIKDPQPNEVYLFGFENWEDDMFKILLDGLQWHKKINLNFQDCNLERWLWDVMVGKNRYNSSFQRVAYVDRTKRRVLIHYSGSKEQVHTSYNTKMHLKRQQNRPAVQMKTKPQPKPKNPKTKKIFIEELQNQNQKMRLQIISQKKDIVQLEKQLGNALVANQIRKHPKTAFQKM